MTRVEFDQLVESLEIRFKNRPQVLTRNAVAWAILGYAVLIAGLLGSLLLAGASAWAVYTSPNAFTIKLGFVLGFSGLVIGYSILRGVWIRLSPPQGEMLDREEVPKLFEMIDSTAAKAGGIQFHRVVLTDELNASVVQIPLLGIFGWHRNYLTLGMQLMDALSPEEFHAVLAHEFAHLSKAHGRTGNWLYRIRSSWENVATSLSQQGGILVRPLGAFFSWFWPRFNARAFILSRANEYEADAFSASATSPATAARALQRIAVESRRLDEDFWGNLGKRASREASPPTTIYQDLSTLIKTPVQPDNCMRWLNQRLAMTTGTADTHPGLRDRISALGILPEARGLDPITSSAADTLLGHDFACPARERFSNLWIDAHRDHWKQVHEEAEANREKLKELAAAPSTDENLWEMLRLRCILDGISSQQREIESWISTHPNHLVSRYILGSHLLSQDNPAGIDLLENVAEADPGSTYECLEQLMNYHDRRGDAAAIRSIKHRADQHDARAERAILERNNLSSDDSFEPHGLPEGSIEKKCKVLSAHAEVREAWLVRKKTIEFPQWQHHVLVVHLKFPALKLTTETRVSELLDTLANSIDTDSHLRVVSDDGWSKAVGKQIKKVDRSHIYTRTS
jgi:Zn-dependent protease with chaperone function